MALTLAPTLPPISVIDAVYRITGTRVSLRSVVDAFTRGATPKQIVEEYPSLTLEQAFAVIAYYLRHRDAVDHALQEEGQRLDALEASARRRFSQAPARPRRVIRRSSRT